MISGLKAVIVWYWLHKQYETGERKVLSLPISDQEGSEVLPAATALDKTTPYVAGIDTKLTTIG